MKGNICFFVPVRALEHLFKTRYRRRETPMTKLSRNRITHKKPRFPFPIAPGVSIPLGTRSLTSRENLFGRYWKRYRVADAGDYVRASQPSPAAGKAGRLRWGTVRAAGDWGPRPTTAGGYGSWLDLLPISAAPNNSIATAGGRESDGGLPNRIRTSSLCREPLAVTESSSGDDIHRSRWDCYWRSEEERVPVLIAF